MKTAEMNMAIKKKVFSSPGPEIEVLEKDLKRETSQITVSRSAVELLFKVLFLPFCLC